MGTDLVPAGRSRKITEAELDAHALWLRTESDFTYQRIADEMGISVSNAHNRVRRAFARLPGKKASEVKAAALEELSDLRKLAWTIAEKQHLHVTPAGKIVTVKVVDPDGTEHEFPVFDDGPAMDAARLLLSVQERETKLLGNDAPVRHRLQVIPQDAVDAEIADLKRENALDEDDDADLDRLL